MVNIKEALVWFRDNGNRIVEAKQPASEQTISRPRAIEEAEGSHISFIGRKNAGRFKKLVRDTSCRLLLVDAELFDQVDGKPYSEHINFVLSDNPKRDLTRFAVRFLVDNPDIGKTEIHSTAWVSDKAEIGPRTQIGPFAVIEADVSIGTGCVIGPHTVVHKDTVIGNHTHIGACSVIGTDGFGFVRGEGDEAYERFLHFGRVVIGDEVYIGNNTCIDRGSLKDTVIGRGVKIDNLVHIAHNVKIGENTLVIACAMVAGSVSVGKSAWLAPSCSIRNGVDLGDGATIGLASTVTKSVGANQTVIGNPAMMQEDFFALRNHQKEMIAKKKPDV